MAAETDKFRDRMLLFDVVAPGESDFVLAVANPSKCGSWGVSVEEGAVFGQAPLSLVDTRADLAEALI